jgi:hypothetical protein
MPRVAPQPAIEDFTAVLGLGPEARELVVADDTTKPKPQQMSAILASHSLTLIIHTRVAAARIVPSPTSAARHGAGHDRDRARWAIARRASIRSCRCGTTDRRVASRSSPWRHRQALRGMRLTAAPGATGDA